MENFTLYRRSFLEVFIINYSIIFFIGSTGIDLLDINVNRYFAPIVFFIFMFIAVMINKIFNLIKGE